MERWLMSFWDSIFNGQTLAEDFSGINLKTEYGKLAENERNIETNKQAAINQQEQTLAEGKAKAIASGFTLEQGLLGSTTRAGSPQSGLQNNQAVNFMDILKWNSQNAPSSFSETGKDKATNLTINTPDSSSVTKTTPQGTSVMQNSGKDMTQQGGIEWMPIVLIAGLVLIVITVIKKG